MESLSLEKHASGIATLWVDVPGESVNTLRADFAERFEALMTEVENDPSIKGLVIASKKPDSFIVGADVNMLAGAKDAQAAYALSRKGQKALQRLEDLKIPTVAAVHGPCLGGGFELALSCQARILSSDSKTVVGLPEVQLGLIPGAGGTQRLPKKVGLMAAIDLIVSGRKVYAKKALSMGLADDIVAPSILVETAHHFALKLVDGGKQSARSKPLSKAVQAALLEQNLLGKAFVLSKARSEVLKKTHGLYPAPLAALKVLGGPVGERGYEAEARAFGELARTPQARALMHIFFASTALKKDSGVDDAAVGSDIVKPVHKVAMLGAGLMGAGIAHVTAVQADTPVRLKDRDFAAVGRGLAHIRAELDRKVKKKLMSPPARSQRMHMITPTTDYSGFGDVDVVIEAVFEDIKIKHQVLQEVEAVTRPNAIFASNTSALPIHKIAEASRRPETVIGMHYFSPVEKMPLLEIVVTSKTAPWVTATCVQLGKDQGKTVIVVNDGVGFYTTRILAPYMNEAAYLLEAGVPVELIDDALVAFGFPVGPVSLLDEVGIDVGNKVGHTLNEAFGERMKPPPSMQQLLDDKRLGRKNKRGFYSYEDDKHKGKRPVDITVYRALNVSPNARVPATDIQERCVLMMLQEAARCLEEGVLRSARDGDMGAVFGLGFPPFLGGPFWYMDQLGIDHVVARLNHYAQTVGPRFAPSPWLIERSQSGKKFAG